MKNWIKIVAESHDHPHARGEDEWFNAMHGMIAINVDAIKRALESGRIKPEGTKSYPVKVMMETIYGMNESEFGSNSFEDSNTGSFNVFGPPVEKSRLSSLPSEKMNEPVMFVMLDSLQAMWLTGFEKKPPEKSNPRPQIVDGNHRLYRRYLEGDMGTAECVFISWEDTKKFTVDSRSGLPLAEIESQRKKK